MSRKKIFHWVCPLCKEKFTAVSCCRQKALKAMSEVHTEFCEKRNVSERA